MFSPETLVFEFKTPWKRNKSKIFPQGNRITLLTIWHNDPCNDGSDDSCGWFMRVRHGCQETLKRIELRFEFNWDADYGGWFDEEGKPLMSPIGITVGMFWLAAFEHFGKNSHRARRFMRRNLFDIIFFAENTCDSLHPAIINKYGLSSREDRIKYFSACVYGWILREERPWWRHPRWHVHHWSIQWNFLQSLRRRFFDRCTLCGKRFGKSNDLILHANGKPCHAACRTTSSAE